ncbi:rhodanese-like domain-containing protein [Lactobacillus jensenii]|uniref:Rhodanese-like domain-containing protein n=1 Tax=Lactobacillus jensenii TaxID=109790 RepID=A0A5N1ICP7_LACJE|nr:rhodanese-like domain-containing protein [Lactobacillus jensenii]EEQ68238.1 rhodanese-like protein [Lactobacillus jensenii 1153]ERJ44276.1 sulfurtransferase [Lactobacillus jensenii MD IIE-70(2)]APT15033.1 sulfurtransferase [Lactobacillus jensenii]EEQ25211.1 rhodanese-like protein [Lactobacillus jensenii 269-3]EEX26711.1 rhodanese-like protein [Lactobacillus jensenii SJ-7A-US]
MNTFLLVIDAILLIIILSFLFSWLWNKYQAKRVGGALSNEEFRAGMRKAQIIDVRESAPFKRKHIDGARNIPMTMFKYQHGEIRKDLPVYLYSDASSITLRAARILQKDGYKKIFWLKDGLENWDGRTKASKY